METWQIIKLSQVEKLVNKVKEISNSEDPDVSFEFFIASLYPKVYDNIMQSLADEYMRGYMEALNENNTEQ